MSDDWDMPPWELESRRVADELFALRAELSTVRAQLEAAAAELKAVKGNRLISALFGHHKGAAKPFALQRPTEGPRWRKLVALGAEFPDGAVALRLANEGGWTTKSAGGAEQFSDDSIEILWLSDELEPLAEMEQHRVGLGEKPAVRELE